MGEIAAGIAISVAVSVATTVVANALEPPNAASRLSDLSPLKASFGESLPVVYGKAKLACTIFWATPLEESIKDKTYQYKGACAFAICSAPDAGIHKILKIWAGKRVDYIDGVVLTNNLYSLRNGAVGQAVMPEIVATEGANVPTFKNVAYCLFQRRNLKKFGNAFPSFEAEVQSHASLPTLKFVLDDVLSRAGVLSSQVNYTNASYFQNLIVKSAVLKNDGSTYRQFIEELQLIYNFTLRESKGLIELAPTLGRLVVPIPLQKMGCQPDTQGTEEQDVGTDGTALYTKQEEFEIDLPNEVQFEYLNPDDNYSKHTAIYRDSAKRQDNPKTIQLADVRVNDTDALAFAQRAFNYAYSVGKQYSGITLPYVIHNSSFQTGYNTVDASIIKPGDTYRFPLDSGLYNQLVTSVDVTPGFIQNISSHDYVGGVGYVPQTSSSSYTPSGLDSSTVEGKPILVETSPLSAFTSTNTVDLLIGADTPPLGFTGGNATFNTLSLSSVGAYTSQGSLTSLLPKTSHLIVDDTTSFNVSISYPLATISTQDWLDAKQVLLVGNELILVREAVLTSPGNYTCKGLIRGWQGTETLILNPAPSGTKVYRVQYAPQQNTNALANAKGDASLINGVVGQLTLRGYDQDDSLPPTNSITVQPTGRSMTPFAPVGVTYDSNSGKICWTRRARAYFSNSFAVPLNEGSENYSLEFYSSSSFSTLLLTLSSNTTCLLLDESQTASVVVSGQIFVKVYQVSSFVGKGFATNTTLSI